MGRHELLLICLLSPPKIKQNKYYSSKFSCRLYLNYALELISHIVVKQVYWMYGKVHLIILSDVTFYTSESVGRDGCEKILYMRDIIKERHKLQPPSLSQHL